MNILQILSDHGINPFAVQLLVESYLSHEKRPKIAFEVRGAKITLEMAPADYNAWFECHHQLEWIKMLCHEYEREHHWQADHDTSATYEMLREVRAVYADQVKQLGEAPPAPPA